MHTHLTPFMVLEAMSGGIRLGLLQAVELEQVLERSGLELFKYISLEASGLSQPSPVRW